MAEDDRTLTLYRHFCSVVVLTGIRPRFSHPGKLEEGLHPRDDPRGAEEGHGQCQ